MSFGRGQSPCDTGPRELRLNVIVLAVWPLPRDGTAARLLVYARVGAKLLAMSAAIWHNWLIGAPRKRSLIAYDH